MTPDAIYASERAKTAVSEGKDLGTGRKKLVWLTLIFLLAVNSRCASKRRMIQSFADAITEQIWKGQAVRRIPTDLQRQALKRLLYLNAAKRIEDLYQPPSNNFHALKGTGRYAIRVNLQWRITFTWSEAGPAEVLFEDYH